MRRRRLIFASIALLLTVLSAPLRAESTIFFSGSEGAINGYDPVAYFTTGKPVKGRADISLQWKGAVWRFSSQANREAFEANPWAFAPQFGGYCAYGASMGYRDQSEPDAWKIVQGKLYLIHTTDVRSIWVRDLNGHIARANSNWPAILSH